MTFYGKLNLICYEFLYIGLGIVMISGISAMMQIGNNINNIKEFNCSTLEEMNIFNLILQI